VQEISYRAKNRLSARNKLSDKVFTYVISRQYLLSALILRAEMRNKSNNQQGRGQMNNMETCYIKFDGGHSNSKTRNKHNNQQHLLQSVSLQFQQHRHIHEYDRSVGMTPQQRNTRQGEK
jgi:hypothetical protein